MNKKWLSLITLGLALILFTPLVGCAPTPTSTPTPTPTLTTTPTNQQPIEVVSVSGPLQPINPGGPIVEITLKNISLESVISLDATIELGRTFTFNFDVSSSQPLLPNNSISSGLTLIGGGFSDNISYPLMIDGILQSNATFTYTTQVRIVALTGTPATPIASPTTTPLPTSATNQEEAIAIASRILRPSIIGRAQIRVETHGWYWEVIFDNVNATFDELIPPFQGPPPPLPGQPTPEPSSEIFPSISVTFDIQTGAQRSIIAHKVPEPGPYISQEQAIESAKESARPRNISWIDKAKVEAYLQGDIWTVLFWEEGSTYNRIIVTVHAVSGKVISFGNG